LFRTVDDGYGADFALGDAVVQAVAHNDVEYVGLVALALDDPIPISSGDVPDDAAPTESDSRHPHGYCGHSAGPELLSFDAHYYSISFCFTDGPCGATEILVKELPPNGAHWGRLGNKMMTNGPWHSPRAA